MVLRVCVELQEAKNCSDAARVIARTTTSLGPLLVLLSLPRTLGFQCAAAHCFLQW